MRKLLLGIGISALVGAGALQAQDPHFSQFYANPLYYNPAFAGTATDGKGRIILNYRNQWPSLPAGYVTYSASFDQYIDQIGGGLGVQLLYDKAGDANVTFQQASLMYAYYLPLNPEMGMLLGVKASVFQRSIDYEKLLFGDQIHPVYGFIYETQEALPCRCVYRDSLKPDFEGGLLFYSSRYYFGASVSHIAKPVFAFSGNSTARLPRRYTVNGGGIIPLDRKERPERFLSPNVVVQMQHRFLQALVGLYYVQNYFTVGAWYRQTDPNGDALILQVGLRRDPVQIGYSYDITMSDANAAVNGSHEASIIVELPKRTRTPKRKPWKDIPCPKL